MPLLTGGEEGKEQSIVKATRVCIQYNNNNNNNNNNIAKCRC